MNIKALLATSVGPWLRLPLQGKQTLLLLTAGMATPTIALLSIRVRRDAIRACR